MQDFSSKADKFPPHGPPPYRGRMNNWLTRSLFFDVSVKYAEDREYKKPVFTLNDPRPGYICAKDTFLELKDLTGRKWAEKYLKDYRHFKHLIECTWFKNAYDEWCEELRDILKMEALERIREIALGETSQALSAAKYLANKEYDGSSSRGRPSKEEISGALNRAVKTLEVEEEDMIRIGLVKESK